MSKKLIPRSSARCTIPSASSARGPAPNVALPMQIRETSRPEGPIVWYCTAAQKNELRFFASSVDWSRMILRFAICQP